MPDASDIQARLRALREAYAEQLPDKLAEVAGHWQALRTSPWDAERALTLHRLVHTLAGSAPTFGFAHVGRRARAAERLLKAWQHEQRPPRDAERADLDACIHALCENRGEAPAADARAETAPVPPPGRR